MDLEMKPKILFQLSGSIACFKACQLLSNLVKKGFDIEVVATKSALRFVGEATLEGLTGKKIHSDVFAPGEYMNHIHLMRWADLVLLCPASANSINKLAAGIGDDLLTTLFLVHDFKKPYLIAPAMNSAMLAHPSVQSSLNILEKWGVKILPCASGALACGEIGDGRLLEPADLLLEIKNHLTPQTTAPLKVMVTSGGTRETIDGVRSIINTSTGRTGSAIAEQLAKKGYAVTFVHAEDSARPVNKRALRELSFVSFNDLQKCLREELSQHHYDVVVHAAAVGDFSLESIESQGQILPSGRKIEAAGDVLLHLKKNAKLVDELKALSKNPKLKVIAFKLTNGASLQERETAIRDLAQHSHADFIVHNDLSEIDGATGRHRARLISTANLNDLRVVAEAPTKAQLAVLLENVLEGKLS